MLFDEYASLWLSINAPRLALSTLSGYRGMLRRHILPVIGSLELSSVDSGHVLKCYAPLMAAGHTRQAQLVRHLTLTLLSEARREASASLTPPRRLTHPVLAIAPPQRGGHICAPPSSQPRFARLPLGGLRMPSPSF